MLVISFSNPGLLTNLKQSGLKKASHLANLPFGQLGLPTHTSLPAAFSLQLSCTRAAASSSKLSKQRSDLEQNKPSLFPLVVLLRIFEIRHFKPLYNCSRLVLALGAASTHTHTHVSIERPCHTNQGIAMPFLPDHCSSSGASFA